MINQEQYKRPWYLFNGHLESIIPYKTYKIYEVPYERARIELADGDFLDVDWVKGGNEKLLVISHALEGNSRDYFVERAAKYFAASGYDVLMWHFRGCSKEMNRLPRFYHTGDTADLEAVISYGLASSSYKNLFLLGFSMGGTTVINYLGSSEKSTKIVTRAAVFSTPLDLQETSERLSKGFNRIYGLSFMKKWKRRIRRKAEQYPALFDLSQVSSCKTLDELHDRFTVRLHGYDSIQQYYQQNSSSQFLDTVQTPLLIANAENDPLLGPKSYAKIDARNVQQVTAKKGGHLGFSLKKKPYSWMELITEDFFEG